VLWERHNVDGTSSELAEICLIFRRIVAMPHLDRVETDCHAGLQKSTGRRFNAPMGELCGAWHRPGSLEAIYAPCLRDGGRAARHHDDAVGQE
jgi:hypothetical protein